MIREVSTRLFGRQVTDRTHHHAGRGGHGAGGFSVARHCLDFGKPEIEDLGAPIFSDEDVVGFQIAMGDALGVGRRKAVGDLPCVVERLAARQPEVLA